MKKSRLLSNLVSYCLMTVLVGLAAYTVRPALTQSCLRGVAPFAPANGVYRSDTGNFISDGDMRGAAQPIIPPSAPQQAAITGYLAQDWQDWSGWAKLAAHYDVVGQGCHGAGPCQRVDVPRLNWGHLTLAHWLRLPPGAYAGSLWVRSSGRAAVVVTVQDGGDKTGTHQFSQKLLAGPAWQQVTLGGRCAGWDNASLTVTLLSGRTSLWVDDVRLERRLDWVSLLLLLAVVAAGVALTHLLDFVVSKIPARRRGAPGSAAGAGEQAKEEAEAAGA